MAGDGMAFGSGRFRRDVAQPLQAFGPGDPPFLSFARVGGAWQESRIDATERQE
jgi:hypothetical protein